MFIPSSFRKSSIEVQHQLIQANPFALLITHGANGLQKSPYGNQILAELVVQNKK